MKELEENKIKNQGVAYTKFQDELKSVTRTKKEIKQEEKEHIYLFSKRMSAYNLSKDNFEEYQRQVIREQDELQKRLEAELAAKMKQQANIPKCPVCGSANVGKISTLNRLASIATVGLASSKIGTQYECKSCKHKW